MIKALAPIVRQNSTQQREALLVRNSSLKEQHDQLNAPCVPLQTWQQQEKTSTPLLPVAAVVPVHFHGKIAKDTHFNHRLQKREDWQNGYLSSDHPVNLNNTVWLTSLPQYATIQNYFRMVVYCSLVCLPITMRLGGHIYIKTMPS